MLYRDKEGETMIEQGMAEGNQLPDSMQLHKLASLGTLISGMCHELNSPITAVLAYSEMLKRDAVLDERSRDRIGRIHDAALRMMKIVDNTLKFSKSRKAAYGLIDLNQVVLKTVPLFDYHRHSEDIKFNLDLNTGFMPVKGDFYQLQQVFFNLIMNAIQALEKKRGDKRISISTKAYLDVFEIVVTDNGSGIAKDAGDVFQSFYTTKKNGLGLGLSIVKEIVEAHGGRISVESEEGEGCSFLIAIPVGIVSEGRLVTAEDIGYLG